MCNRLLKVRRLILIAVFAMPLGGLIAQDFMLQGWYWDYPKTSQGANWADNLRQKAGDLSNAGFTQVWLPPLSRASSGTLSNGYDPRDLFDLGEYGLGPTGFGSRADVDALITALSGAGIAAVADVVYNHRDGGAPEENPSVAGWVRNMNFSKIAAGDQPFPSDRFRLVLPIGGTTGLGTGTYYFKFGSKSGHPNFHNKPYKVYMETNARGFQGLGPVNESEPNGGGGCGEGSNVIELGRDMFASIDAFGCTTDEFALTLHAGDFDPAGDAVYIYLNNRNVNGLGDYSDHTVLELYYTGGGGNIESRLIYQTYTDFRNLPSGQGAMNHPSFKPNGAPTQLAGDFDAMFFFYDYDQNVQSTRDVLFDWTSWLWNNVGIRGYRLDAVKQFPASFVGDLLDYLHDNSIDPGMVVGEFFDGNPFLLNQWINDVYASMDADTRAAINPRVFDFSLRYALEAASDAFGYDVRNVFNASMVDAQGTSGFNVVTFTDNHDFRGPGQRIDNDPILAYAYILTNNQLGLPCVFYDDYYGKGLQPQIDQLISLHRQYISGAFQRDYLSRFGTPYVQQFSEGLASTTLLYQLSGGIGGKDVIVAINYAGLNLDVSHGVNTTTMNLAPGMRLVELTGNSTLPQVTVDAGGRARFVLPPRSYGVWVADDSNQNPLAQAGADATFECTGNGLGEVTLTDGGSSDPDNDPLTYTWSGPFGTVNGAVAVVSLPLGGPYAITLTVSDGAGGTATDEVLITVSDTQLPVVSCPDDVSVKCFNEVPAVNLGAVSAIDACEGSLSVSLAGSTDDEGACYRIITRTFRAEDGSGNAGTCTQTIIVEDDVLPTVACPSDVTVECIGDVPAVDIAQVSASDNCTQAPEITHVSDVDDGMTDPKLIIRTYRATDVCGNSRDCEQRITVDDTQAPVIQLSDTPIALWPPNSQYVTIDLADCVIGATDNCDAGLGLADVRISAVSSDEPEDLPGDTDGETTGDILISSDCRSVQLRSERIENGNGRVYTIDFEVSDAEGNTGTASFQVKVPANRRKNANAIADEPAYTVETDCSGSRPVFTTLTAAEDGLMRVFPNPFREEATIGFYLPAAGQAALEVFDLNGRRLHVLLDDQLMEGWHQVGWNGTDGKGNALGAGTYLLFFRSASGTQVDKISLFR